ncbi:MAG: polyprenyl synthetase family protein [Candidatus Hydrogenedentota bacterium]
MTDVSAYLKDKAARTEEALEGYFNSWNGAPHQLADAMRYSLFAGGKRLRPGLVLGAAEIVSGDDAAALPAACAIEMIHTYSLIHDDLPSMDDDALRRGRPTSHIVHGEAMAILTGDTLLAMAFDIISRAGNAAVVGEVARAAGAEGMAGGQVIDLLSEDKQLTLEELRRLHAYKTGALIRVSVRAGAMLAGTDSDALEALTRYGEHIGLAFQIADDILNVTGTEEALGKPVGSDLAHKKSTYPGLVGLNEARRLAEASSDEALRALEPFGAEAAPFRALARYIIDRNS